MKIPVARGKILKEGGSVVGRTGEEGSCMTVGREHQELRKELPRQTRWTSEKFLRANLRNKKSRGDLGNFFWVTDEVKKGTYKRASSRVRRPQGVGTPGATGPDSQNIH